MTSPPDRHRDSSLTGHFQLPLEPSYGHKAATDGPPPQQQLKLRAGVAKKAGAFRFFVVDNPAKLKDREQMRANRKHVMNDYLDKERQNPSSTDARVTRPSIGPKKRKRSEPPESGPLNHKSTFKHIFSQELPPNHLSFGSGYVSRSSPDTYDQVASSIEQSDRQLGRQEVREACAVRFVDLESSPEDFTADEPRHSLSLTPPPSSYLGSNIQPFNSWPTFSDPLLDTEKLKWSCKVFAHVHSVRANQGARQSKLSKSRHRKMLDTDDSQESARFPEHGLHLGISR
jgi:hypothetical protein